MDHSVSPEDADFEEEAAGQHEFIIESANAGERLDAFLASRFSVSRARAQKYAEAALVNGAIQKGSYKLRANDNVAVTLPQEEHYPDTAGGSDSPADLPPILFEDEHLLILNKPRGLVVHPGAGQETNTLVHVLRASGRTLSAVGPPERAGIVHRLDKDTSGLIIVCKTDAAHWKVADDFATRRIRKNYLALVCGIPPLRGRIEAPIARHPSQRKKMAVVREGRPAITEYVVVKKWAKFSLLDVDLFTGRTHQIRVHLAYIGNPVVADGNYGGVTRSLKSATDEALLAAIQAMGGQALHAARLGFEHPVTGEALKFEVEPPEDMELVLRELDGAAERA